MIKIVHIITGLGSGGAENMLLKLLLNSDSGKYYHEVISLIDKGTVGPMIEEAGFKVHEINISLINIIHSVVKMAKICKSFDIVDTWLYHADFIGIIISKLLLKKKLIWNIRHSNLSRKDNKIYTFLLIRLNAFLSKYVDIVTYNSNEALINHENSGYSGKTSEVTYNGFDLKKFKFDKLVREQLRKNIGIYENARVLVTVGRWYTQKDYPTLLKAIYEIKKEYDNFILIMCGVNLDTNNYELMSLIKRYNLTNTIYLLGKRTDINRILTASDIYVSSSLGESFSNAIGEAMACQLPCVVTDVGESKNIVGNTGIVCEPRNPEALSQGLFRLLNYSDLELERLGKEARKRIEQLYDIKSIARKIESIYDRLI